MKDSKIEEPKVKLQSTTHQRSKEVSDKTQREKKKDHYCNRSLDRGRDQRGQKSFKPASEVNTLEPGEPAKKKKN